MYLNLKNIIYMIFSCVCIIQLFDLTTTRVLIHCSISFVLDISCHMSIVNHKKLNVIEIIL